MQLEELREFHNQARAEASGENAKEENERQSRFGSGRGDKQRDNQGSRFTRYTPLIEKIFGRSFEVELILQQMRASSPGNADRSWKCQYHQNSEHTTEECREFKDKIEELIQVGHLGRFVQRSRGTKRSPPREERVK